MREKTFHVYVDSHDRSLLLARELKNLLIQQGRYTCVDELLINAPLKIKTIVDE